MGKYNESPHTDSRTVKYSDRRLTSHTPGIGLNRGVAIPELRTPLYKGQNLWCQWCSLKRGSTDIVHKVVNVHFDTHYTPYLLYYILGGGGRDFLKEEKEVRTEEKREEGERERKETLPKMSLYKDVHCVCYT